jgi:hypothetical protein
MSKSGVEIRGFGPTDIVVLHQADIGEFLRDEDTGAFSHLLIPFIPITLN